jgi:hypothetical protein
MKLQNIGVGYLLEKTFQRNKNKRLIKRQCIVGSLREKTGD